MKTMKYFATFAAIALLLGSCENFFNDGSRQTSKPATLRLSLTGAVPGLRTIGPVRPTASHYSILLVPDAGVNGDVSITQDGIGDITVPISLPQGGWTLTVQAHDPSHAVLGSSIPTPLLITAGLNAALVDIIDAGLTSTGEGTLDVTFDWPDGAASSANFTLTKFPYVDETTTPELVESPEISVTYTLDSSPTDSARIVTVPAVDPDPAATIPSGTYMLALELFNGTELQARVMSIVNIYDGLLSTKLVTLGIDDINLPPPVPTNLGIMLNVDWQLIWAEDSGEAIGYNIYLGSVFQGSTFNKYYPIMTPVGGEHYEVRAYNRGGESASSTIDLTAVVVTYYGNGATSGTVPASATLISLVDSISGNGDLEKLGHVFVGWNTMADGSGDTYLGGQTLVSGLGSLDLYAMWGVNVDVLLADTAWPTENILDHDGLLATAYRSATIADNGITSVTYSGTVPQGAILAKVSFWYKVSSESDFDYLNFKVDDVTKSGSGWSGEIGWTKAEYSLSISGSTGFDFTWIYSKDETASAGFDAAWIDDIQIQYLNYSIPVPRVGLVGEWLFNGDASDTSGNSNNGSVTLATLDTDRFGNPNAAYLFGAGKYITIADTTSLRLAGSESTISLWYKATSVTGLHALLNKAADSSTGGGWAVWMRNSPRIEFWTNSGVQPWTAGIISITAWQNVTIIIHNSSQLIDYYIDGVFDSTSSIASYGIVAQSHPLLIGSSAGWVSNFEGLIDDIRIYERALALDEIVAIRNEAF